MELVAIKCPNCGGTVEMDSEMKQGFCLFCGSRLVNNETPAPVTNITNITNIGSSYDSDRFYLIAYYNAAQTKHLIEKKLKFVGHYRKDAMYGDAKPLQLAIFSNDVLLELKNKGSKYPTKEITVFRESGKFVVINNHGYSFRVNGEWNSSSEIRLGFGDIITFHNISFRFAPYGTDSVIRGDVVMKNVKDYILNADQS